MFEYLIKKLEPLLDKAIDPVIDWLEEKCSLRMLVIACVLFIAAALTVYYNRIIINKLADIPYIFRVAMAEPHGIPLAIKDETRAARRRLQSEVMDDLSKLSDGVLTPWSVAQDLVAVSSFGEAAPGAKAASPSLPISRSAFVNFIGSRRAPSSQCWGESRDRGRDFCLPVISGWVFYAFAEIKQPVSAEMLDALASEQHEDGWWPTFPANKDPQFASTYTTAWVLLGLARQQKAGLVADKKKDLVDKALKRGADWLISARQHARWKRYPNLDADDNESESVSALVQHTLNQILAPEDLRQLNRDWLDNLPDRVLAPDEAELYYMEIRTPAGLAFDHFAQLKHPWMIVATLDSFPGGDLLRKAKALKWLERNLNDDKVSAGEPKVDWIRAELLYGLNYAMK